MPNELLFVLYVIFTAASVLLAARVSREALIAFIAVLFVVMNLFVIKQIHLLGYNATAADALGVGAAFAFALLQEFHGRSIVKKTVMYATATSIFYVGTSLFHLSYIPSPADMSQPHFEFLLTPAPRILAASLTAGLIVQWLQSYFFSFLNLVFRGKWPSLRNFISVATLQFVDIVVFAILGLWGRVDNIMQIIMVGFVLKVIAIAVMSSVLSVAKRFVEFPSTIPLEEIEVSAP